MGGFLQLDFGLGLVDFISQFGQKVQILNTAGPILQVTVLEWCLEFYSGFLGGLSHPVLKLY